MDLSAEITHKKAGSIGAACIDELYQANAVAVDDRTAIIRRQPIDFGIPLRQPCQLIADMAVFRHGATYKSIRDKLFIYFSDPCEEYRPRFCIHGQPRATDNNCRENKARDLLRQAGNRGVIASPYRSLHFFVEDRGKNMCTRCRGWE